MFSVPTMSAVILSPRVMSVVATTTVTCGSGVGVGVAFGRAAGPAATGDGDDPDHRKDREEHPEQNQQPI